MQKQNGAEPVQQQRTQNSKRPVVTSGIRKSKKQTLSNPCQKAMLLKHEVEVEKLEVETETLV